MMSTSKNLVIGWLIIMVAIVWFISAHSEPPMPCIDEASREKVRNIMLDGIDEALKDHTKHMYEVWMKDPREQPSRAITGMKAGITAYANSRAAALRFNPPSCTPKEEAK
jgi:hypothetical protein